MKQNDKLQVPHLTTTLTGPLRQLEKELLHHQTLIETWLRQQWRKTPPPIYSSVDLRNAGFKLAPVDTNLFPAGFNNLNPDFLPLGIQAAQATIEQLFPGCQRIVLIPESHTRNTFYLENIAALVDLLTKAGFDVRVGSLLEDVTAPQEIALPSQRTVRLEPLERTGNQLGVKNFPACLILLNNDLSEGIPPILQGLEQPIVPALSLGWSHRLKSKHFAHYDAVCNEFAELIQIDPWLINPIFRNCGAVHFLKREGEDCVAANVASILQAVQRKYQEYGIEQKPFAVIKADAGTYGMGVMMVHDPAEIYALNRKERTKMSMSKGKKEITQVIIQEGVYTFETWGKQKAVAEPVVYMLGQHVIGGFYRIHTARGISDNLNAPGMQFKPLAFVDCCNVPDHSAQPKAHINRFYAYGVIARLALVAAAREGVEV